MFVCYILQPALTDMDVLDELSKDFEFSPPSPAQPSAPPAPAQPSAPPAPPAAAAAAAPKVSHRDVCLFILIGL